MDNKEKKIRKSEANRRYRQRRKEIEEENKKNLYGIFGDLGLKTLDILDSAIQASVSNPLMGITSAILIGDILYRAHVIDLQALTMIYVSAGVLEGAAVADTVLTDLSSLTHFFQSQGQAADPITPTATTIVFQGKNGNLDALMNREGKP